MWVLSFPSSRGRRNSQIYVFSVAPKILEALKVAETYMETSENFAGKVRFGSDLAFCKVIC